MSFPRFLDLPYELREAIWSFAIPEPVQEVCITRLDNLPKPGRNGDHTAPLTVYTSYPAVMHTCREAREIVLRECETGDLQFVHLPEARCAVPVRPFDPVLDILYWPNLSMSFSEYIGGYNGVSPALDAVAAGQLRHLAVEWGMMNSFPLRFVDYILRDCPALEHISVVFPHVPERNGWQDKFPHPTRRSRLQLLRDEEQKATQLLLQDEGELDWYASLIPNPRGPYLSPVDEFMATLRLSLNSYGSMAVTQMRGLYRGTAWNAETRQIEGFDLIPMIFTEYLEGRWYYGNAAQGSPTEKPEERADDLDAQAPSREHGRLGRLFSSIKVRAGTRG